MKVGFTGAHGVGKTTLCRELAHRLNRAGIATASTPEVPRQIADEVGEPEFFRRGNNTLVRQFSIIARQLLVEVSVSPRVVLLCDRTLLDHWCYTLELFPTVEDEKGRRVWDALVQNYLSGYDMLFYVPIEFSVVNDGVREGEEKFQLEIDALIREKLNATHLPYEIVGGTLEERAVYCERQIRGRLDAY